MQVVERRSAARQATAEDVDAYIDQVMRELRYPFFLYSKIRGEIREFLCSEIGLGAALSELPADQLGFRIGEPGELAQSFAETCKYVRLRGAMPIWKKRLIAAAIVVVLLLIGLFVFHVQDQWKYNHGDLKNKAWNTESYDSSKNPHSTVRRF